MPKKTTLEEISDMLRHVVKHMANRDDIAEIRNDMARKEQIIALHTQINSIETDLRGMKRDKLVTRVADLEDEVFGKSRATRVRVVGTLSVARCVKGRLQFFPSRVGDFKAPGCRMHRRPSFEDCVVKRVANVSTVGVRNHASFAVL